MGSAQRFRFILLAAVLLFCFQNCGQGKGNFELPSLTSENGNGYAGGEPPLLNFASDDVSCADHVGATLVTWDRASAPELARTQCQWLEQAIPLTSEEWSYDPSQPNQLIYQGIVLRY